MRYKHPGSYETITGENGNLVEKLSFDPCLPVRNEMKAGGRRRNPLDGSYTPSPFSKIFDRGYTGHEHLDIFGLINMNGRVYDPWLGRMLSPDPFVQAPGYSQNYNRYSYAFNNPLKFTDPTGYYMGPSKDLVDGKIEGIIKQSFSYIMGPRGQIITSNSRPFVNSGFARLDAMYARDRLRLVLKEGKTVSGLEAQDLFRIMKEYNIYTVNGVEESYAFMQYRKIEAARASVAELNAMIYSHGYGMSYGGDDPPGKAGGGDMSILSMDMDEFYKTQMDKYTFPDQEWINAGINLYLFGEYEDAFRKAAYKPLAFFTQLNPIVSGFNSAKTIFTGVDMFDVTANDIQRYIIAPISGFLIVPGAPAFIGLSEFSGMVVPILLNESFKDY